MVEKPGDGGRVDEKTLSEQAARTGVGTVAGAGGDQQLQGQRQPLVARPQGGRRGQRATRAVAADSDSIGVQPPPAGVGEQPPQGRPGVVPGRREGVLRGQAIVQGQHRRAAAQRELPAQAVVGVQPTQHEPTAVEIQQHRAWAAQPGGLRAVQASRSGLAITTGEEQVFHPGQRCARQVQHFCPRGVDNAGLGRAHRMKGFAARPVDALQHPGHAGGQQVGAHGEPRLALAGHQKSVMGPQYAGAATGAPCPQRQPASAQ